MSIVILFAILGIVGLLVVPALAELVHRVIDNDGYGRRADPPRSHHLDPFDRRGNDGLLPR